MTPPTPLDPLTRLIFRHLGLSHLIPALPFAVGAAWFVDSEPLWLRAVAAAFGLGGFALLVRSSRRGWRHLTRLLGELEEFLPQDTEAGKEGQAAVDHDHPLVVRRRLERVQVRARRLLDHQRETEILMRASEQALARERAAHQEAIAALEKIDLKRHETDAAIPVLTAARVEPAPSPPSVPEALAEELARLRREAEACQVALATQREALHDLQESHRLQQSSVAEERAALAEERLALLQREEALALHLTDQETQHHQERQALLARHEQLVSTLDNQEAEWTRLAQRLTDQEQESAHLAEQLLREQAQQREQDQHLRHCREQLTHLAEREREVVRLTQLVANQGSDLERRRLEAVERHREQERLRQDLGQRTRELEKCSAILANLSWDLEKVKREHAYQLAFQDELQGARLVAEAALETADRELAASQSWILALTRERDELLRERQEMAAQRSELAQMRTALDEHAIVSIADANEVIIEVNDLFCRVSGYSREEVIGQTHHLVRSNHHPEAFHAEIGRTIRAGQIWRGTLCNRAKDGSPYWVEGTIIPFLNEEGHPIRFVSVRTDITRRVAAEEETASLALFTELNPSPMLRVAADGCILAANRAAATVVGTERLKGCSLPELAPWAGPIDFARCIAQGESIRFGLQVDERYFYFLVRGVPERNVCAIYGSDITQAREAERKLDRSHQFLSQITEHMGEGVYALDAQGRLTFLNQEAERLLGWKREELMGQSLHDIIHFQSAQGTHLPPEECPILQVSRTGQTIRIVEDVFTHRSGLLIPVAYVVSPLWDHERTVGSVTVFQDITQRKQAEQEIRLARDVALEVSRMKSEFLANMSHEIRTPMNGVIGMTNLMLATRMNREQKDLAVTLKESAQALLTVINDILEFSRIEAGKMEMVTSDWQPAKMVTGVVELLLPQTQRKGLTLVGEVAAEIPHLLRGDQGRIRQVLLNLVGNAIKFTERGGVVLRASLEEKSATHALIRFAVTDTGIGIPKEFRHRLFQPFTQIDGSAERRFGGTGLGLSISARLVELMGGQIGAESKKGKGSTFWFQVPLLLEGVQEAPHTPSAASRLRGYRALVVDSNATSQTLLLNHLLHWNMKVTAVESPEEAWSVLHHEAETGIITDLLMVDCGQEVEPCFELGRKLQGESFASLKKVLLTSINEEAHFEAAIQAGYDIQLVKPLRRNMLSDSLIAMMHGDDLSPLPSPLPPATTPQAAQEAGGGSDSPRLILLVEDNIVYQKVTQRLLNRLGYVVHTAGNGKESVEAVKTTLFALILMDCLMPVMNGVEAAGLIRQVEAEWPTPRHTPIIAMTATPFSPRGDANPCLGGVMDDYLTKPVDQDQLRDKLAQWLGESTAGEGNRR